jgi:serine/threonine protein phosphatase PrpC
MSGFLVERDFAGRQSIGSRDEQQDAYAFSLIEGDGEKGIAESFLLLLADGMGGYQGGREAAMAAVQGFVDAFFGLEQAQDAENPPGKKLKEALLAANSSVLALVESDEERFGDAGTTLLAMLCKRDSVHWISVGDSPLFLWRKKKMVRLNEDHSMRAVLARKVAEGQMSAADVETHPERNMLLAALNGEEPEKIDAPSEAFKLEPGDILLAASDGLLSLPLPQIEALLTKNLKKSASDIVRLLLDKVAAQKIAKQDNATIAVIKI